MLRFAVFVSGNGSNLQAIIDAVKRGDIKAELALVISDRENAVGLKRAEKEGFPARVFSPKDYTNRQSVDRDMVITLRNEKIDFIVLAGYMRLLTAFFVNKFPKKIINVHPSLLPNFKGVNGIKDAFTYGSKVTGVTIHFVNEKMDNGPIIMQEPVCVLEGDTKEKLEKRIHKAEHRIYPRAIQYYVDGRLKIRGRQVKILEELPDEKKK
ncbi:MAG: phosphoribosylglycinamide formyltransferase [Candidatus Omnitrophica bacterium]|nr:phosphoribosylglycinamide formyltransferase [Candidatus Omnitrophota bacterium]